MAYGGFPSTLPTESLYHDQPVDCTLEGRWEQEQRPAYHDGFSPKPPCPYRRSIYNHKYAHKPADVIQKKWGSCSAGSRPLCLRAGYSKCWNGKSWCETGAPPGQQFNVNWWQDDYRYNW